MTESSPPLAARRVLWSAVVGCFVSAYALALQNNAMNVAGPVLAYEFSVGVADASAVILVYTVPIAATLIAAGRLGDVLGARRMFRVGIGMYLVTSVLAGLANGLAMLLVVRFFQAFGASLVVSNQLGLAARSVGAARRGEIYGIINFMAYAGQVSGPVIGGLLTAALGWRWLFWMNVPLALWLLVWGIGRIPPDPDRPDASLNGSRAHRRSLDVPGAVLLAASIGAVLTAVNRSPSWGPASPQVLALVALAVAFGAGFVRRELTTSDPMLDLRLFQHRDFSAAVASSIANFVTNSGLVLLLPFYLVEGHGVSVESAGMLLVPLSILMAFIAPVSGRLGDRVGPRIPSTVGMVLLAVGTGALALFPGFVPILGVVMLLIVAGAGIGLFSSANAAAIMGSVPEDRLGVAGGVVHTARYIGLTGGVALAGAVYSIVAQADPSLGSVAGSGAAAGSVAAYRVTFAVLGGIAALGAVSCALMQSRARVRLDAAPR